jgi:hypothetical protein
MTSSNGDSNRLNSLELSLDTFIYESQRLFTRLGEIAERNDAAIDSMAASIGRLTNGQLRIDHTLEQVVTVMSRLDQRQADLETLTMLMNQRQADLEAVTMLMNQRQADLETVTMLMNQRQADLETMMMRLETMMMRMDQRQADLEAWKIESDRRHQENEERFNVLLSELRYIINRKDNLDE